MIQAEVYQDIGAYDTEKSFAHQNLLLNESMNVSVKKRQASKKKNDIFNKMNSINNLMDPYDQEI